MIVEEGMSVYDSSNDEERSERYETLNSRLYVDNQRLNKNLGKVKARLQVAEDRLRYIQLDMSNKMLELEESKEKEKKVIERLEKIKERGKIVNRKCYWMNIQRMSACMMTGLVLMYIWFGINVGGTVLWGIKGVFAVMCVTGDVIMKYTNVMNTIVSKTGIAHLEDPDLLTYVSA